ncbi:hypothetical protein Slin15195_G122650 [Septoria linicola]|uniref:Uncharacterized protein n=1 Tax=Septoria linicola TaxID=215465 RepID=A0A9Q9B9R1_9PEZI|nr:hypothetical protein Slin14017_G078850 [Septoria linicola]USW58946.1 hypothetical protein Slin15195_G122650 [Septoria linicola]
MPAAGQGQASASIKEASRATFLHLPAELRNEIYTLSLVHHRRLVLEWRGRDIRRELAERNALPRLKRRDHVVLSNYRNPHLAIGFLLASRQISLESAPVFYGCNEFEPDSISVAHAWTQQIGESVCYLRKVYLWSFHDSVCSIYPSPEHLKMFSSWLKMMRRAEDLDSITLRLDGKSTDHTAKRLASVLFPLFQGIQARREQRGIQDNAVTSLKMMQTTPLSDGSDNPYGDEVKELLRKMLS